ncbi:uncharacterized protein [Enoplosus armatus]|uniref:uncharacterized protein isoform X2 n=1 Tax=Enoplosus armatus TaxID=215367 RepID=UPI00399409DB
MAGGAVDVCSSTKTLNLKQSRKLKGSDYLGWVSDLVSTHKHKTFLLKNPAGARWTIGDLDDTIYRGKHDELNEWGKLYIPDIVSMQVVGVVKGTSCPELVLMTCEDKKLYAYDGEKMHVVASRLEQLDKKEINYPASKSYYKGEAFKDMAAEQRMTREEEFLKKEDPFRRNALWIVNLMVNLNSERPSVLVDEILHSIFFLGKINKPPFSPRSIVTDNDMLKWLYYRYPRPFRLYSSQLPKRSPISCVLDMIVHLMGQKNEDKIIKRMQEVILQLKKDETQHLVSSAICVSQNIKIVEEGKSKDLQTRPETQNTEIPVRYYGVSMSTLGSVPGRIIGAASCLSAWDNYVADAVMTYFPEKSKKPYFDGTIKLPEQVRCQAFSLINGQPMPPCRSCGNLFGLTTSVTKDWAYGNCAEPESVSNLLKNESEVREQARPTSATYTDVNRKKAEENVKNVLWGLLRNLGFEWDNIFYTPQTPKGKFCCSQ